MSKRRKWAIFCLTLFFIQASFANTTFQQELDDFSWSLGKQYGQEFKPSIFNDIQSFTKEHHQDYLQARTESLKKWQVSKIDTSGFKPIRSEALDEYTQELFQTSLPDNSSENFLIMQHWKILTVESMTATLANYATPFLAQPPLDFPISKIGSLLSIKHVFGMRYATVPLGNDEWEIWAYSYGLAYKYKWDLKQSQIKDFSLWIKEEHLK